MRQQTDHLWIGSPVKRAELFDQSPTVAQLDAHDPLQPGTPDLGFKFLYRVEVQQLLGRHCLCSSPARRRRNSRPSFTRAWPS